MGYVVLAAYYSPTESREVSVKGDTVWYQRWQRPSPPLPDKRLTTKQAITMLLDWCKKNPAVGAGVTSDVGVDGAAWLAEQGVAFPRRGQRCSADANVVWPGTVAAFVGVRPALKHTVRTAAPVVLGEASDCLGRARLLRTATGEYLFTIDASPQGKDVEQHRSAETPANALRLLRKWQTGTWQGRTSRVTVAGNALLRENPNPKPKTSKRCCR